jgi:hypothetical protein
MDLSHLLVAFGGFIGGLLVASRVFAWIVGSVLSIKSSMSAARGTPWIGSLAPIFLHSGPWFLAIVIGVGYYVASLPDPLLLWALLAGLALAASFLGLAIAMARHRRTRVHSVAMQLTPERLATIRRRFFWINTLSMGVVMTAGMLYQSWSIVGDSVGLLVFAFGVSLCGGWLWSWFMWQWYGTALQSQEDARRRREKGND